MSFIKISKRSVIKHYLFPLPIKILKLSQMKTRSLIILTSVPIFLFSLCLFFDKQSLIPDPFPFFSRNIDFLNLLIYLLFLLTQKFSLNFKGMIFDFLSFFCVFYLIYKIREKLEKFISK